MRRVAAGGAGEQKRAIVLDVDGTLFVNKIDKHLLSGVLPEKSIAKFLTQGAPKAVVRDALCEWVGHFHNVGFEVHILTARPAWLESLLGRYATDEAIREVRRHTCIDELIPERHVHRASHAPTHGMHAVFKGALKGGKLFEVFHDYAEVILIDDQRQHVLSVDALKEPRFSAYDVNDAAGVAQLLRRLSTDGGREMFYHPEVIKSRVMTEDSPIALSLAYLQSEVDRLRVAAGDGRFFSDSLQLIIDDCCLRVEAASLASYEPDLEILQSTCDCLVRCVGLIDRVGERDFEARLNVELKVLFADEYRLTALPVITQTDHKIKQLMTVLSRLHYFGSLYARASAGFQPVVASAIDAVIDGVVARLQASSGCREQLIDALVAFRCSLRDADGLPRLVVELLSRAAAGNDDCADALLQLLRLVMRSSDEGAIEQLYGAMSDPVIGLAIKEARVPGVAMQLRIMQTGLSLVPGSSSKAMILADAQRLLPDASRLLSHCLQQLTACRMSEGVQSVSVSVPMR